MRTLPTCAFLLGVLAGCGQGPDAATSPDAGARVDAVDAEDVAAGDAGADDAPTGPRAEVGTGGRAWQELPPEGGTCEVVFGPQGGYHIYARVRFAGISPDVFVRFRVVAVEGGRVFTDEADRLRRMPGRGLVATAAGYESASGELAILQIRGPSEVVGMRVRLEAIVTEAAGAATVTDGRACTAVDDEP